MNIQSAIQTAGIIISIIGGVIAIILYFSQIDKKLSLKLALLESTLRKLRDLFLGHIQLTGTLLNIFYKKHALDNEDFKAIIEIYSELSTIDIPIPENPLTSEEIIKLKHYIEKAKKGEFFTPAEVQDFNRIIRKIEKEKPDDPNIWPLLALGAFLLGLFLGSKSK